MTEYVYLGHDNTIDLLLKVDGVIYDITSTTKMEVEFGSTTISSATSASAFDWTQGDGKLYLTMGAESIPTGTYNAVLTVYDATNTDGVVWNTFKCKVE